MKRICIATVCRAKCINFICKNRDYEKVWENGKNKKVFCWPCLDLVTSMIFQNWIFDLLYLSQTNFFHWSEGTGIFTIITRNWLILLLFVVTDLFLPVWKYFCFMDIPPIPEMNNWVWIFGEIGDRVSILVERTLPRFRSTNKMDNFYILSEPRNSNRFSSRK